MFIKKIRSQKRIESMKLFVPTYILYTYILLIYIILYILFINQGQKSEIPDNSVRLKKTQQEIKNYGGLLINEKFHRLSYLYIVLERVKVIYFLETLFSEKVNIKYLLYRHF